MSPKVPEVEGLEPDTVSSGAVAGFTTGVFSIPEGMAYAQLAGVNPLYGLYSGLVATLVASLTTGTVLMISTLTSAIALSTGSVLEVADVPGDDVATAVFTITLLTGAVMLVLGLLRLGSIVSFVSSAVMTGFVAGASLLILIGEMGDLTGYEPSGANKVSEVVDWFAHIGDWDPTTTAVGTATIVLVLVGKRISALERLAPVIVLALMTIVIVAFDPSTVATVADIASVPRGLPGPALPDLAMAPDLALGSLSVAIVALIQGAGISSAYPNPNGSTSPPSRDFVGQGLGNVAASLFQSMPTGGSLSRTGISVDGGARSRWGGVFAAVWLGALVLLFGQVAELVPLPVIGGLLFVVAAELIAGRLDGARLAVHSSIGSAAAMILTFVAALFIPLQWTIFLGAGLSLAVYIGSSFRAGELTELIRSDGGYWREEEAPTSLEPGTVTVLGLRDWRFYADVPRLAQRLPRSDGADGAVLVIRMRDLPSMRDTGLRVLDTFHGRLADDGVTLVLAGVRPEVADVLRRTGLTDRIGTDNIFEARPEITGALDQAWAYAESLTPDQTD